MTKDTKRPANAAQDGPPPEPSTEAADEAAAAASEPVERVWTDDEVQAALAAKEAELGDRYLRLAAEYQNFRRRVEKEKEQLSDEALERFAKDLIPVLDAFDRALAVRGKDPAAAASGIELVDKLLKTALDKHGVVLVDPAGAPFDPKFHEAMVRTATSEKPAGTVLSVLEKGWRMKSRLLRAARVQVAAAPEKT